MATLPVLLLPLLTSGVGAATQRPLDLEQKVALSEEVVVGTVRGAETRWEGNVIITVASIQVAEAMKGQPPTTVEVTQLGGTAAHPRTGLMLTMTASTQVALDPGEEVLLFLDRNASGERQLVGAHQGKYLVRPDSRSGEKQIPVGPKHLVALREGGKTSIETEVMTLDIMRDRIRRIVDRQSRLLRGGR